MAKSKKLQIGTMDYKQIYDWSGGMNDYINPALLNDNESARLENASLDEKGTLFPAKGSRTRFNIAFSDKGINGLGAFYKSDGTTKLLIGADNELYCDNPHIITTYDSQTDWDSGAKQNMVSSPEGDIKPTELQLPTFTRSSVAYLSDGTQVAANTPRLETGKFGQAIMIEEGTTNVCTNGSFESNLTGWTFPTGQYERTSQEKYFGSYSLKLTNPDSSTTAQAWFSVPNPSSYAGKTVTVTVYAKTDRPYHGILEIREYDGSTYKWTSSNWHSGSGQWEKLTLIMTFRSTVTDIQIQLFNRVGFGDNTPTSVYFDGVLFEQKPYPTSFIDGTRSPEFLTIPTAGVLNPQEGTVEFWVKVPILANYNNFFSMSTSNGRFLLYCRADGSATFDYGPSGSGPGSPVGMLKVGNWHYIVLRWSVTTGKQALFIDGVKYEKDLYNGVATSFPSTVSVVNNYSAYIDDLRISSRARTDAEIAAAYNSGLPLPVDEWTAYKMNMDDNLLPAQRDITKILGFKPVVAGYNGAYWLMAGSSGEIKKYDGASTTDLSTTLGFVGAGVYSIAWNGTYWLIAGGSGRIKKYDGSTVTDLTSMFNFGVTSILTLAWNGTYWLIAGGVGKIKKYDGSTVTDLTSMFKFGVTSILTLAWNGTYWLIAGGSGRIKKYDGSTVTDLTSTFGFGTSTINVINWNGSYFLIGADSGKIKKYDGSTVTDLTSTFGFGNNAVKYISWNGSYFLVSATNGKIKKYDGTTVTNMTGIINLTTTDAISVFYSDYYLLNTASKTIKYLNFPDSYTYAWYSPTIDISNAIDKNSGHIAIEADTLGGSAIVVKSRSSADGKTWSDWFAALTDGTLQHPANNYIQIVIQAKKSKNSIPVIHKATISYDGQAQAILLASDFSPGGQFYFDSLLDSTVIVNGIDAPRKYDGTTISLVGGSPPHGTYVVTHKNRMWMARGSTIYFSEILNFEVWDALNFIQINPNDGDTITGLKVFGDYLVITKQYSVWLLTGDGKSNFAVKRIHSDRGCYAPRSLIVVDGNLCFVSDDGIYMSDLTQAVLISERIRNYWNTLNSRRLNICASYYGNHKLYVAVPEGNSMINNAVIVFDTLRKAFVGIRRGWNVSCWANFRESGKMISLFGHSDKGQVSEINVGYSDNGQPINLLWKSKEFDFDSPETYKRWNKIYIDVKPAQYDADITLTFFVDGRQVGSTTITIPAATAENAIYSVLALASKAGVVGGRRLAIQLSQAVNGNPVGIHRISIEYIVQGVKPTLYI